MTQAILTQILNQLETLELKELQLLNQKIQQYLMDKEEAEKQAVFHQSLLDAGLVKQIKRPSSQPITDSSDRSRLRRVGHRSRDNYRG